MKTKVKKRDDSVEDFEEEKIIRVLKAAGLDNGNPERVAKNIFTWLKQKNIEEISSLEIRDKLLEELRIVDTHIANLFAWYQKTKETD